MPIKASVGVKAFQHNFNYNESFLDFRNKNASAVGPPLCSESCDDTCCRQRQMRFDRSQENSFTLNSQSWNTSRRYSSACSFSAQHSFTFYLQLTESSVLPGVL
uniref:CX domain-containing protein n=1 Tax=Heterorhabditis bacteriophora TaxID=37862 RepID=A0A1I7XM80_HETBA